MCRKQKMTLHEAGNVNTVELRYAEMTEKTGFFQLIKASTYQGLNLWRLHFTSKCTMSQRVGIQVEFISL